MKSWDDVRARVLTSDCHLWAGSVCTTGYGQVQFDGQVHLVHRLAYEQTVGSIPEGFVIDHVCHDPRVCVGGKTCLHRRCINPEHLAAVTNAENLARQTPAFKTHCVHGHLLEGANVRRDSQGHRNCVTCQDAQIAGWKAAVRERVAKGEAEPWQIRAWAKAHGHKVADRGALRNGVIRAFYDFHNEQVAS